MKLSSNKKAPDFSVQDVYGQEISLQKVRGKLYLAFERNSGCPVCNLRVHTLLRDANYFKSNHITVVMIYESSAGKMREYLGDDTYPFHFVADPENRLYNLYGVERSMIKMMKGLFNGLLDKVKEGTRLFKNPIKQDGHVSRIPAEFIVDEKGVLSLVHYGRFIGDHLEIKALKEALLNA